MRGLILAATLAWAGVAAPHASGGGDVETVLDAPAWPGVTVQLRKTLAPQILLANRGSSRIEVLDDQGRPFIRVTDEGVWGDMAAAAWYNSYSVARLTVPEKARDRAAPAQWQQVSGQGSFGWFDPRLAIDGIEPPESARHGGDRRFGQWRIPVLVDGEPAAIAGHYRYREADVAQPRGRLLPGSRPAGVSVGLIAGPVDALTLSNGGTQAVTVLGLDDEPYLRIGPDGVRANLRSRTWRTWGRNSAGIPQDDSGGDAQWVLVAGGRQTSWLEPRTRPGSSSAGPWQVPIEVAGERYLIRGETQPVPPN